MRIVLDYDQTYTLDKGFWDEVIQSAKNKGHEVLCVTGRAKRGKTDNSDIKEDMRRNKVMAIYCNYQSKADVLKQYGFDRKDTVFIDDLPEFI